MKQTVTLGVASRETVNKRFLAAFEGEAQGAYITSESPELLFQTLTKMRWNIIKTTTRTGPLSIREIALTHHPHNLPLTD
ncbi:MAG: hypothetical protein QOJ04_5438 [Caballeronia sp.]|nr:hypothetical protein [Caballeronia sp.]